MQNRKLPLRVSDLALAPPIAAGVRDAGFEQLTPIQQRTLPDALAGQDV
ncbi:MAG TPA: DEAD/DEAH box helicase, partial [Gammaproteobacteria bacterium]|nr:DEAD/DEAH box helicase [Gammaproteobacteria bacterium]